MYGERTEVEYLPPPFSPSPGEGGGREAYPNEFSNIITKIIVNLKPKVRVIGAEEWTAVVTLHPPPTLGEGGRVY